MESSPATALPLEHGDVRFPLDEPFTAAMAMAMGIDKAALHRLRRDGQVRRLLRGVYVDATVPDSTSLRARAMAHVVDRRHVAVDRSAAWVHGVDLPGSATGAPIETLLATRPVHGSRGSSRELAQRDVESIEGLRVTTPLRTALDVGRLLAPDLGLAAMDRLLAGGRFTHRELLAELARLTGHRGIGQLRGLAAQVDARSASVAESVLRHRWHQARLPTAVPGFVVAAGPRAVRLTLAAERRQFGAALLGSLAAEDLVALEGRGWRVVVVPGQRVLTGDPEILQRHLEREFHQQLLTQLD